MSISDIASIAVRVAQKIPKVYDAGIEQGKQAGGGSQNEPLTFLLEDETVVENVSRIVTPEGEVVSIAGGEEILWQRRKYKCEVEYLESTTTQYIDTGVILADGYVLIARTAFVTNPAGTSAEQINGTSHAGRSAWGYSRSISPQNFYVGIKEKNINTNVPLDTLPHTFMLNLDGNWGVDDHTGYSDCGTTNPDRTVFIFARNTGSVSAPCAERCYFCQIFNNGVLVRDFIPVLDWNDRPCMYDKVTDELFYNQGTGEFLYE